MLVLCNSCLMLVIAWAVLQQNAKAVATFRSQAGGQCPFASCLTWLTIFRDPNTALKYANAALKYSRATLKYLRLAFGLSNTALRYTKSRFEIPKNSFEGLRSRSEVLKCSIEVLLFDMQVLKYSLGKPNRPIASCNEAFALATPAIAPWSLKWFVSSPACLSSFTYIRSIALPNYL